MLKPAGFISVLIVLFSFQTLTAQDHAEYANRFLNSLNQAQKLKALYKFDSDERYDWHFVPKDERIGIMLGDLNETQKKDAFNLLKTYLSENAFNKTTGIIQLELVLKELEKRREGDNRRDPGKYTLAFFGKPSKTGIWGWRFEGHHISFSFSTRDNKLISGTPGFMGANPAVVLSGPQKGKQVLKEETEIGFKLLHSLDSSQLSNATIAGETPKDIVTYIMRKASLDKPEGLLYSQMNKEQQKVFDQLLQVYLTRYTEKYSKNLMTEIRSADINQLRFGWAGARNPETGKAYYYRIHGPGIIIEYDNSQNNANHIHTVIRDLKNDFGDDQLKSHLKTGHSQ